MSRPDAERWRRIEATLTAALSVATGQREAVLDRLCAGEDDLRREVESLLAAHRRPEPFLSASAGDFAVPYLAELPDEAAPGDRPGTVIGRYRLLEEIGRGGMGAVWLAERADGQFEHRVALKLIKRGMDSDEILARFLRERQILARLEHPNIARLLDGGVSDDGRPYFVMEHVHGLPLTRFCDERQLPIEERLRLLGTVCRAVQYAHRNLIVHRDLKPSNVLVTERGEIKLLDFGVAKLLAEDSGEATLTRDAGGGPLTPQYASPEQLKGQPVTTASDVYQLGVLLFEVLTGQRPFRTTGWDLREIERLVLTVDPPRPSSIAPASRRRRLLGDLDAIVLRALRKQPEQRQPSAEALAEDLERHLAHLPIRYGGGDWWYDAGKFLRRYRLRLSAVAVVAITATGFGGLYLSRVRAERDRAQREVAKTTEMTAALRRVFRGWNPDAADRSRVSAEMLLGDAVRRAKLELAGEPEVLAATLSLFGDLHYAVGQRSVADSLLSQALAIQEGLTSAPANDLGATIARRGWILLETDRFDEAAASFRRALDIYRSLPGAERQEAIEARYGLARVLTQQQQLAASEREYRDILGIVPVRQEALRSEISAELGYVLFLQARYEAAVELLRPTLDLQRRLFGTLHQSTLRTMRFLASSLRDPAMLNEAEALDREALAITRALFGKDHIEVFYTKVALAVLLERKGTFLAADSFARDTVPPKVRGYGDASNYRPLTLRTLGAIRLALGDTAGSEGILRRALAGFRMQGPPAHPDEGDVLNRLAALAVSRGAPDADTLYAQAVAFERARPGDGPHFVTDGYEYLGWAAQRKGDLPLAEMLYRRAVRLFEQELPAGHPYRAQSLVGLGETLLVSGRPSEAEGYLREGLAQWQAARPSAPGRVAEVLRLLQQLRGR